MMVMTLWPMSTSRPPIQLKLAPNSYFPYISADDQLGNPVFTVSKLTNTEMVLLYEGNGITWRFMLTSKDEGEEAQPEAKVDWDYASAANLWKAVDEGSAFEAMGYYFADNNWSPIAYTEATHTGDAYELTLPEGLGGSQWQGVAGSVPYRYQAHSISFEDL